MAKSRWGSALGRVHALLDEGTMGTVPDGVLLGRYSEGDRDSSERSFAALVDRHGPMVLRVCRTVLGDEHAAHDAFQATFLVLARKAASLWVHDSIAPWLYRVAVHTASAARNAAARRRKHEQKAGERLRPHPVEAADAEEIGPILHQEIDRLPDRYRAAIVLCYLDGLTHDQAAERLGCPVGTVRSRLAAGRERLRRRLILRGLSPDRDPLEPASDATTQCAVPAALAASTVRITMNPATATGSIPTAVVALAREELTMILLSRWKYASLGLILAIGGSTAGVLALAQRPEAPERSRPPSDGAGAPMPAAARRLLEARIETAREILRQDMQRRMMSEPQPPLIEEICTWSRRLMDDRLRLDPTPAGRLDAIREHRGRMIFMERLATRYAQTGQARMADSLRCRYHRLEADQLLAEAGVDPQKEPAPDEEKADAQPAPPPPPPRRR